MNTNCVPQMFCMYVLFSYKRLYSVLNHNFHFTAMLPRCIKLTGDDKVVEEKYTREVIYFNGDDVNKITPVV